ncbi:MAG: hydrolase [Gemmatimonadota bacterium]|nr:MAG: hydrolase [Gemmatimonadota bacterium]
MSPEASDSGLPRLWATWRMGYIKGLHRRDADSVFSQLPKETDGPENLIVHRGVTCYVVLNLYPYNSGHCMVVPFREVGELSALSPEERLEIMDLADLVTRALRRALDAQGFNMGMNLGKLAGAGIPNHLHMHIVPRWTGDTNFMPVVGDTKVLPESLEATYAKVRDAIRAELDEETR